MRGFPLVLVVIGALCAVSLIVVGAEVRAGPWGEIRQALEDGEIDTISGMFQSARRDEVVDFSPPFTVIHHAIFMRRADPPIEIEEGLKGKEIIVMRGDIMHDYVLEQGLSESPVLVGTTADALRLLASGEHDCALVAHLPGLYWTKELDLSNIVTVGPLLRPSNYSFAVRNGNNALRHLLDEGLFALAETGEHQEIHDKWLGVLEPRHFPTRTFFFYLMLVVGPLVLLLTISMGRSAWLNKHVAHRTEDLRRSEEKWRSLTAHSPDKIMLLDCDGTIRFINHTVPDLTVERVLGTSVFKYIPESFHQGVAECFERVVETQEPGTYVTDYHNEGGGVRHYETRVAPLIEDGKTVALVSNSRDITERKQAEMTIEAWQNRYKAAVKASGQILYDWDSVTDEVVYGGCLEEVLGYSQEEMAGGLSVWKDLVHPDDLPGFKALVKGALKMGQSAIGTCRVRKRDGEFACLEGVGEVVRDEKNHRVRLVGFLKDITEQKQAQAGMQQLLEDAGQRVRELRCMFSVAESIRMREKLEEIFEEVVTLIPAGWRDPAATRCRIRFYNKEYVSKSFEESRWRQSANLFVAGELRGTLEVFFLGEHQESNEEPFQTEEKALLNSIANALSEAIERHHAEAQLEKHRLNLAKLVEERTVQLNARVAEADDLNSAMVNVMVDLQKSNSRLEAISRELTKSNKELDAFSYSVSHDLRAPLRHIAGFVGLLGRRERDRLDDTSLHYLETIEKASERMGCLIDDLLAFSRTGRTAVSLQLVDSNETVREVLVELSPLTKGRKIAWIISDLPAVEADRGLLLQVWQNLIGNAIKYTGRRDEAEIEIGAQSQGTDSGETVFFIRDNGVGFDLKYSDSLFGVFQRLHRQDQFEGTGIGLATVHRIVDRHGGRIWAEGEEGRGAAFFFTLKATQGDQ